MRVKDRSYLSACVRRIVRREMRSQIAIEMTHGITEKRSDSKHAVTRETQARPRDPVVALYQKIRLTTHGINREKIGLAQLLQILHGRRIDAFDEVHYSSTLSLTTYVPSLRHVLHASCFLKSPQRYRRLSVREL